MSLRVRELTWNEVYCWLREKEKKFGTPLLCFLLGASLGIVTATYKVKPLAYTFIALAAGGLVFYVAYLVLGVMSSRRRRR